MAGYNFAAGRSNNMIEAEDRGMITIGRWGKRYSVSAAAVREVMRPAEAHHTGTGRRGKSRLTYVINWLAEPTSEQLATMKDFDCEKKKAKEAPPRILENCSARYITWPSTRTARRIPTEHVEKNLTFEIFEDGQIVGIPKNGRCESGWQKLSGLVIAQAGEVVHVGKINMFYDDPEKIAADIS